MDNLINILRRYSNNIAYKVNDDKITYKELLEKAISNAELLKRQGSNPVIIYGHKKIDMVISIISCLLAKRAYIPIDTWTPVNRILKIIEMTSADLIIKTEVLNIETEIEVVQLDDLSKFENHNINKNNNDIAYIIFTSGSTGQPKGVPISYTNLENFIDWISNIEPLKDYNNVTVLNQASFSFDLSVADFFYSMFNGNTLVGLEKSLQEQFNPIFDILKKENIDVAVMTPTFIKMCLLNSDFNYINFPRLKCLYFCGEQLEKNVVSKIFNVFPNVKVVNAYGPTEATSAVSSIVIDKEMINSQDILPVGNINDFATEIIIDNDEIVLKGKSVFSGYLGNLKGGFFKENGINCYRTGDLGIIKNNMLYCLGRKDNQIKYKGYRIELNDIETNILNIDGVKDCAVVSKLNDERAVKMIKAFVVLCDYIDESDIKKELNKILPEYMIPKIIKKVDKLPINKNGKIDRKLLSDL